MIQAKNVDVFSHYSYSEDRDDVPIQITQSDIGEEKCNQMRPISLNCHVNASLNFDQCTVKGDVSQVTQMNNVYQVNSSYKMTCEPRCHHVSMRTYFKSKEEKEVSQVQFLHLNFVLNI